MFTLFLSIYLYLSSHASLFASPMSRENMDYEYIRDRILEQKKQYLKKNECVQFGAFFDYDGTIIHGDMTDGLKNHYHGLAYKSIKNGFIPGFKGKKGYLKFRKFYDSLLDLEDKNQGTLLAYDFMAMVFSNTPSHQKESFDNYIQKYFSKKLAQYHYPFMLKLINELIENNIQIYVISASPHVFVQTLNKALPIPKTNLFGFNASCVDGIRVDPIVHFAQGKVRRLQEITNKTEKINSCKLIPVAAFGNSWSSDGPFLDYVSKEYKGISVMVNAGIAPEGTDEKIIQMNLKL